MTDGLSCPDILVATKKHSSSVSDKHPSKCLKRDGENQGDRNTLPFNRTGIHEKSTVSRAAAVDGAAEQLGELRRNKSDLTKSSYTPE